MLLFEFVVGTLKGVDWWTLVSGAVLGVLTLGLRTVLQAPIKALIEHARVIQALSFVSPQQPFSGQWEVAWKVNSTRFREHNPDVVKIYSLFGNVTFTMNTSLRDGTPERCVFVGKLTDRTLTGRWFDPKDASRAYFGVYQVRLGGGLRDAAGVWIGWTNDGDIQANEMLMKKVD